MNTTQPTPQKVPDGYREDAQGRLVHESQIKPIDKARDELAIDIAREALALSKALAKLKASAFGDIESFVQLSAEEYGVSIGGKKGNVSLLSFDGRFKVQRAVQESIAFDERLQAAKALLDECLRDWTADARPEVATIVQDAFRVDQAGNIRTAQVLALRRLDISDERWQRAMQAISDAVQVVGSKAYIRVYERVGDTHQYRPIALDIAAV